MYCENCELRVETSRSTTTDTEEAQRYGTWFDDSDVTGDYTLTEVGDVVEKENDDGSTTKWSIGLRVDTCVNCAVPIRAKTYLDHWDF